MPKSRILALTSRIPFPVVSGGQARMYHLLRQMAKEYEVDLLSIHDSQITDESSTHLRSFLRNTFFYSRPELTSRLKALYHAIVSGKPLQIGYYYYEPIMRWLEIHYQNYDLIFCFHVRTAEYVLDLQCKKVVDLVDAISLGYMRAIKSGPSVLWSPIYRFELPRLLKYEKKVVGLFNASLVVSSVDEAFLAMNGVMKERLQIVPHGTEVPKVESCETGSEDIDILFHGKMDYPPNEAACNYFLSEIMPLLVSEEERPSFHIVGYAPTRKIKKHANGSTVIVTGYVPDIRRYLRRAKVIVAPMTYGAGVKTKVLEAMGMGKAVVTTTVGAEGIDGQNGVHFLVADNPKDFARRIKELLVNPDLRIEMGNAARKLIAAKYTWDKAGASLLEILRKVVASEKEKTAQ
jgi:sugar transferase (PEP-CTERM/EpsH1 system associated)